MFVENFYQELHLSKKKTRKIWRIITFIVNVRYFLIILNIWSVDDSKRLMPNYRKHFAFIHIFKWPTNEKNKSNRKRWNDGKKISIKLRMAENCLNRCGYLALTGTKRVTTTNSQ